MNNMIKNKARRSEKSSEIEKIVDTNKRHVTFCKRRAGVFKKASELCVLTGAECAVICESFGGHVFAFGHPSVESIVDKYLGDKSSEKLLQEKSSEKLLSEKSSEKLPENVSETSLKSLGGMHDKLKKQYLEISEEIKIEKNKSINDNSNNSNDVEKGDLFWWQQPFDHLEVEELEQYISSMEQLMNNLKLRADDLKVIRNSSSMFNANKTLNSNDEKKKKNLMFAKDDGLPDELFVNKKLNFSNDGLVNEFLSTMKVPNFNDNGVDYFLRDLELGDNNAQVPNTYGNLVVPDDDGGKAVVDLHNFDTDDFSLFSPT